MRLASLTRAMVTLAAAGLLAGPASAASIGGFGARPAHFDPRVPATRAYFIRSIPRGGSFSDQVVVINSAPAPVQLLAYPVDGLTGATSGVVYGNRGSPLTGDGRWIHIDQGIVTVPARSELRIGFTATAPADARPGVHLAGFALQTAAPRTSASRFEVRELLRAVVGIEMIVPGSQRPQITLRGVKPTASQSLGAGFTVTLDNTGTGLCKPTVSLTVTGGTGSGRVIGRLDTMLPGDTIPYPVPWPRALAPGRYAELVTATGCGTPRQLVAAATIGTPQRAAGPAPPGHPTVVTAAASGTPWWLILAVAAGGLAAGLLLSRARRQGRGSR
jgi:hypothetical protein